ncbi:MAG TPA: hypothetical protein VMZ27_08135, partial [Candidatus Saccharimonadales bacterium]|nr:hypothetical protein [Candidatus Saccharimonadales bacterium]
RFTPKHGLPSCRYRWPPSTTLSISYPVRIAAEIAIEGSRSYFDTNTSNHFHYFLEDRGELVDFGGDQMKVTGIPVLPKGTEIDRIDVIVRLRRV